MLKKTFNEKTITRKIIVAIILIFIFNFIFSSLGNVVFAGQEVTINVNGTDLKESEIAEKGGKFFLPLYKLVLKLADAVLGLMQENFTLEGEICQANMGDFEFLDIKYTPAEIFSNNVPLFNINFFSEELYQMGRLYYVGAYSESKLLNDEFWEKVSEFSLKESKTTESYEYEEDENTESSNIAQDPGVMDESGKEFVEETKKSKVNLYDRFGNEYIAYYYIETKAEQIIEENPDEGEEEPTGGEEEPTGEEEEPTGEEETIYYKPKYVSWYIICPISWYEGDVPQGKSDFANRFNSFINSKSYIKGKENGQDVYYWGSEDEKNKGQGSLQNGASEVYFNITQMNPNETSSAIIQKTASNIYKSLRIVAIVALLSILVYVGIRMVISSTSKDKAKYKQMFMDWLIAFIMLFALHYIMAFVIDISEKLTGICNNTNVEDITITSVTNRASANSGEMTAKIETNFVGLVRFYAGLVEKNGHTIQGTTYCIMYIVLVIYLVVFSFQYMRRVIYMAFLTMISPLVAITYPLDKLNDGSAQGFNMWLKEYIFNAILQPIHYIIYVIIISSVMGLIVDHPVYALVALGFMTNAEKIIKKMFGFDKAKTVGEFGGAAGAAMLMGGIQKLTHKPHGSDKEKTKGKKESSPSGKIRSINSIPLGPGGEPVESEPESAPSERTRTGTVPGGSAPSKSTSNTNTPSRSKPSRSTSSGSPIKNSLLDGSSLSTLAPRPVANGARPAARREKKAPGKVRKTIRGLGAMGSYYTRKMENAVRKSHPLRTVRRGITYGVGAATLGTIGLAAGIASGDASKAFQYTTAGVVAGGNLGKNLGETASSTADLKGATKAFKAGYMGDKYSEHLREKNKKEFMRSPQNVEKAIEKLGTEGAKDFFKDGGIMDQAYDYGLNLNDAIKVYKARNVLTDKIIEELEDRGIDKDIILEKKFEIDSIATQSAFKGYDYNKMFGDYWKNHKTQENLDKILDSKGFAGETKTAQRMRMLNLMEIYQDAASE